MAARISVSGPIAGAMSRGLLGFCCDALGRRLLNRQVEVRWSIHSPDRVKAVDFVPPVVGARRVVWCRCGNGRGAGVWTIYLGNSLSLFVQLASLSAGVAMNGRRFDGNSLSLRNYKHFFLHQTGECRSLRMFMSVKAKSQSFRITNLSPYCENGDTLLTEIPSLGNE